MPITDTTPSSQHLARSSDTTRSATDQSAHQAGQGNTSGATTADLSDLNQTTAHDPSQAPQSRTIDPAGTHPLDYAPHYAHTLPQWLTTPLPIITEMPQSN